MSLKDRRRNQEEFYEKRCADNFLKKIISVVLYFALIVFVTAITQPIRVGDTDKIYWGMNDKI